MLTTRAPRRTATSIACRAIRPTVVLSLRDALTTMIRVLPATPFPPMPLPSSAPMSPATNVPWPTLSTTLEPFDDHVVCARDAPGQLGLGHVDAGAQTTATRFREPPPAA